MVGIQGLGGVPEPKSGGPAKVRNDREEQSRELGSTKDGAQTSDGVSISTEARAAAEVSRIVALTSADSDIRAERVEQARQRLEQGAYKDPDVVRKVAERILRFL